MSRKSLVRSLLLSYLWITLIAVILIGLYGAYMVRHVYLDRTAEDLDARAKLCRRPIVALLDAGKPGEVDAVCKEWGRATGSESGMASQTRVTVILPSGRVIGDTMEEPRRMDNHGDRPEVIEAMSGSVGTAIRFSATVKKEFMYVAIPAKKDDQGVTVVRTSVPVTEINQAVRAIYLRIVIAGLIVTGLLAAVSIWLSTRIGTPLRVMGAGAERFAQGRFEHRLPASGFEEISALGEGMNRMAEQLNERIGTIRRQRSELEAILSSMSEGVLAIDNQGTILSVNRTCADLLGTDREQARRQPVHEVVRIHSLLEFIESSLSNPAPMQADIRIRGKEDQWLSLSGTALHDADEQKMGVLIVLHDVTRLRRLENVRRDFVANVSHELKTPITSIKGFVETMLDGALSDKENAERFLQIISRQVNRLDAIIEDLLTLSRLEKGPEAKASRLELGPVRDVLLAAVEMCESKAAEKEIEIKVECASDLVITMNGPLLEQAVVNLVDNAIKYSEPGGGIMVTATREGDRAAICVRDWGCGIEPMHVPRLFERFYRVDKARSRELGGTGLGLAIVKHIVLVHAGTIDVESEVGEGSKFSILIPLTNEAD